jgi:hypothetical protein
MSLNPIRISLANILITILMSSSYAGLHFQVVLFPQILPQNCTHIFSYTVSATSPTHRILNLITEKNLYIYIYIYIYVVSAVNAAS